MEMGQFTLHKPRSGLEKSVNPFYISINLVAITLNPNNLIFLLLLIIV